MSKKASGTLKRIGYDQTDIELTADNDCNFYPGGDLATEAMEDVNGSFPKLQSVCGRLTNITARAATAGSLKKLTQLIQKTSSGEFVDLTFELANGERWGGRCYAVGDPDSFFGNQEAKIPFGLYAADKFFKQL